MLKQFGTLTAVLLAGLAGSVMAQPTPEAKPAVPPPPPPPAMVPGRPVPKCPAPYVSVYVAFPHKRTGYDCANNREFFGAVSVERVVPPPAEPPAPAVSDDSSK